MSIEKMSMQNEEKTYCKDRLKKGTLLKGRNIF